MKKVIGIVLTMVLAGVVLSLSGCYTKSCSQPAAPMSYKDDGK